MHAFLSRETLEWDFNVSIMCIGDVSLGGDCRVFFGDMERNVL